MCGICGIASGRADSPDSPETIRAMTQVIRHRGPDDEGIYGRPGIQMGVRRLSIIDLKTGEQPILNEDETIAVVCNGEIYNFIELREQLEARGHRFRSRSDVEVIVHLYEEYGTECLDWLRGMFAFALWDAKNHQLMLARDRLGIKPLYYALARSGALYFGSEMKTILIAGAVERRIDALALRDLFTLGFVVSPKTMFAAIKRLPAAHYLLYRDGAAVLRRYWRLSFPEAADPSSVRSAQGWAEAVHAKLEESVKIHLRSDVPVGAWLSGGIDSSAIVSLMARLTNRPVHTFSLVFDDYRRPRDVADEKTLAQFPDYPIVGHRVFFKKEHFNLFPKCLWHDETPTSSAVAVSQLALAEAASKPFKVILTGEGSDEIFGGYPWYRLDRLFRPFAGLPVSVRRALLLGSLIPKWKPFASQVFLAPSDMGLPRYTRLLGMVHPEIVNEAFSDEMRCAVEDCSEPVHVAPSGASRKWHGFAQLQHIDITTRLCDFITSGLDGATMAYSVEARVPFLDHELVELCARIPPSLKMRWLTEKHILRRAMRNDLPAPILAKKKRGLGAPANLWLRDALPEFAGAMLSEETLRKKGYFKPLAVRRILSRHRSGEADYTRILIAILGTQIWDELFVRGCRPAAASHVQSALADFAQ
jgi:asparagine synthase (glutamine-hydrolysing)